MDGLPNREKLDELLAFLPGFCEPGRRFVVGVPDDDQDIAAASQGFHPAYSDDVISFFMLIGLKPWMDANYLRQHPERFLTARDRIAEATYPEVRALLNLCARGERFADGYWIKVLEEGIVQAALKRLDVLSDSNQK